MLASTARMTTERPTFYLKQLCQHFADAGQRHSAQEFEVSCHDYQGFIDFAPVVSGTCRLDARQEGVLTVEVRARDQAALKRVQRIVTTHLERFGRSDGLTVEWGAASEQPATGEVRSCLPWRGDEGPDR